MTEPLAERPHLPCYGVPTDPGGVLAPDRALGGSEREAEFEAAAIRWRWVA